MLTYEPLRILLVKRKVSTTRQLAEMLGCSTRTAAKLYNDETVSLDVIERACGVFNVGVADIIEYRRLGENGRS